MGHHRHKELIDWGKIREREGAGVERAARERDEAARYQSAFEGAESESFKKVEETDLHCSGTTCELRHLAASAESSLSPTRRWVSSRCADVSLLAARPLSLQRHERNIAALVQMKANPVKIDNGYKTPLKKRRASPTYYPSNSASGHTACLHGCRVCDRPTWGDFTSRYLSHLFTTFHELLVG